MKYKLHKHVKKAIELLQKHNINFSVQYVSCNHCGYVGSDEKTINGHNNHVDVVGDGVYIDISDAVFVVQNDPHTHVPVVHHEYNESSKPFKVKHFPDRTTTHVDLTSDEIAQLDFQQTFPDFMVLCPNCGSDNVEDVYIEGEF